MKTSVVLALLIIAAIAFALAQSEGVGETISCPPTNFTPPARILPTTSDQVDILSALIAPERIVAMPEQALTWSRVAEVEGWRNLPTFSRFLAEFVLESRPDLVLVSPFAEPDSVARLRESGIDLVSLPVRKNIDDVIAAVRRIGGLVGEVERAEALVADIEKRRDALLVRPSGGARPRALAYVNFGSGGWSAGRDTTIDCAMRLAGLDNAVGDRIGHFEFSFEELVALNPDFIIVSAAFGESEDTIETMLRTEPGLARAQAVMRGRFLRLPPRLASAGSQELIAAAEVLVSETTRVLQAAARETER